MKPTGAPLCLSCRKPPWVWITWPWILNTESLARLCVLLGNRNTALFAQSLSLKCVWTSPQGVGSAGTHCSISMPT